MSKLVDSSKNNVERFNGVDNFLDVDPTKKKLIINENSYELRCYEPSKFERRFEYRIVGLSISDYQFLQEQGVCERECNQGRLSCFFLGGGR